MVEEQLKILKKGAFPGLIGNYFQTYIRLTNSTIVDITMSLGCTLDEYFELSITNLPSPHRPDFLAKLGSLCDRTSASLEPLMGILTLVVMGAGADIGKEEPHRYWLCPECQTKIATRGNLDLNAGPLAVVDRHPVRCPLCGQHENFKEVAAAVFCKISNIVFPGIAG